MSIIIAMFLMAGVAVEAVAMKPVSQVIAKLGAMERAVDQFDSKKGLFAALAIHMQYNGLATALETLSDSLARQNSLTIPDAEEYAMAMESLSVVLIRSLGKLQTRAGDFQALRLQPFVQNDLSEAATLALSIQRMGIALIPSDAPCSLYESASTLASAVYTAFQGVGEVYACTLYEQVNVPVCPVLKPT